MGMRKSKVKRKKKVKKAMSMKDLAVSAAAAGPEGGIKKVIEGTMPDNVEGQFTLDIEAPTPLAQIATPEVKKADLGESTVETADGELVRAPIKAPSLTEDQPKLAEESDLPVRKAKVRRKKKKRK